MTLFDFARNNISRDRRNYIYYFVNCVFSVFVFFLFTVLSFHPAMSSIDRESTMGFILIVGEFISIGFSICFISYSVGCFLKARSRQFGVITILGASKKQLNKLVFLENMIVGFTSIVTGILLGFVFSKFFLDIANKVIGVSDFTFYFPVQARDQDRVWHIAGGAGAVRIQAYLRPPYNRTVLPLKSFPSAHVH